MGQNFGALNPIEGEIFGGMKCGILVSKRVRYLGLKNWMHHATLHNKRETGVFSYNKSFAAVNTAIIASEMTTAVVN